MAALIQAKLTPQAAVASMTTGRRFGAIKQTISPPRSGH
jgi:Delta3-Delta2-enoyl-CoA isomerase